LVLATSHEHPSTTALSREDYGHDLDSIHRKLKLWAPESRKVLTALP